MPLSFRVPKGRVQIPGCGVEAQKVTILLKLSRCGSHHYLDEWHPGNHMYTTLASDGRMAVYTYNKRSTCTLIIFNHFTAWLHSSVSVLQNMCCKWISEKGGRWRKSLRGKCVSFRISLHFIAAFFLETKIDFIVKESMPTFSLYWFPKVKSEWQD